MGMGLHLFMVLIAKLWLLCSKIRKRAKMMLLKRLFKNVGKNFQFDPDAKFSFSTISVGNDVYLGPGSQISADVTIGNKVMFGPMVHILGGDHKLDGLGRFMIDCHEGGINKPIIIEDDVWIGSNAFINKGVTLGRGCVVGAATMVTKDVPPYAVVVGNPAKIYRYRFNPEQIKRHEALQREAIPLGTTLLVSPLPPPIGGVASWTENVLSIAHARGLAVDCLDTNAHVPNEFANSRSLAARFAKLKASVHVVLRAIYLMFSGKVDRLHLASGSGLNFARSWLLAVLAHWRGLPAVLHFHSDMVRIGQRRPLLMKFVQLIGLPKRAALVVCSEADEREAKRLFPNTKAAYLPNILPLALFETKRETRRDNERRVLFVGWLIRAKGVFELVEAMRAVPDVKLTMLGPIIFQQDYDDLKKRVKEYGLENRILFPPTVGLNEMPAVYASHDVLVLPSHTEGFATVLAEAMAVGLPLITTPVGIAERLTDGVHGRLFPIKNVDALTEALQDFVGQTEKFAAIGRGNRRYAAEQFHPENALTILKNFYQDL